MADLDDEGEPVRFDLSGRPLWKITVRRPLADFPLAVQFELVGDEGVRRELDAFLEGLS